MVEFLDSEEIKYDVIAGAFVGSLNGILFASTEIGREKELSKKLDELWSTIKSDNDWPYFGIIRGFFDKTSFFDNSPLLNYITSKFKSFGNKIQRKYTITAVNINTAETIRATENVGAENIPKYVVAPAAVPGFFPCSNINGNPFIDGGTIDNTNIRGGIERCREIVGDDDSLIIVDVMMTNTVTKYTRMNMKNAKSYTLYTRGNQISEEYKTYFYLKDTIAAFPEVNWRYLILPKESLPNYPVIALSFDRVTLKKSDQRVNHERNPEFP